MRTFRQHQYLLAVVGIAAVMMLSPGFATAAYDQSNQSQYQDQSQELQRCGQPEPQPSPKHAAGTADRQPTAAARLRHPGRDHDSGHGQPRDSAGHRARSEDEEWSREYRQAGFLRRRVDNRLHVNAQAKRLPDAELEKDTYDNLGDNLSQSVQVRAQNGMVTLQGQLDNWSQVADAIDAAFKAGATQVNSQFSVAGAGAMAQGGAGGYYPPSGYAPGQQGQPILPAVRRASRARPLRAPWVDRPTWAGRLRRVPAI